MSTWKHQLLRIALGFLTYVSIDQSTLASEPHLFVDWPADWEFRHSMQVEQQALFIQGRRHTRNRVTHELTMTLIDIGAAREAVTNATIEDLAKRLRERFPNSDATGALQPFANARGYYFIATDTQSEETAKYKHLIEGVMLDSGYLMEFVLQSNDANAPDTLAMLSALGNLAIR